VQRSRNSRLGSKLAKLSRVGRTSFGLKWLPALIFSCVLVVAPVGSARELQEIQQQGQLIVAVKGNLRPLGFVAGQQLQGFEIDIAQRLAQELLNRPDAALLQSVNNTERLTKVLDGSVDVAIARVTATSSRSRLVAFSIPYYLDGTAIVTKEGGVQRLADLGNRPVAVLNGSSTIAVLRYHQPQAQLVGVDSYQAAYDLLETGEAIAFVADVSVLAGWVQEYPQYRLLPERLSIEPLCIVLPKGVQYDELRRRINDVLARWHAEGWLQQRAAYWGLPWGDLDPDKI
jgi:polar amino acid transport system substrate-binding protein